MKRVLVICGDAWHSAETIRRGMMPLRGSGFEFEYLEGDAGNLAARLPDFSVVALAKANMISATDQRPWVAPPAVLALQDHLRRGRGVVAIHAGTSRYESSPEMMALIGGLFEHHPEQCAVTVEPCANHPLAAAVAEFTVRDEHYFMAMSDAASVVFLHSRSAHGVQPAGWTRAVQGGRVCVLTPGHNLKAWLHPEFQKLLLNALRWTAKLD
jgi:type 1 glutamine amidotransferase